MMTVFEAGLTVLVLFLIALGIAILGDHVTQSLSRSDPWPRGYARRLVKRKLDPPV